jgi:DnaK suppressor protein
MSVLILGLLALIPPFGRPLAQHPVMNSAQELSKHSSLDARKSVIEAKLAELSGTFQDRSGLTIENSADPLDVTVIATDRDVLVQQMNISARMLAEVRKALDSLESGKYGYCEDCDEPISSRRLDAIPWARVCVKCQQDRDRVSGPEAADDTFSIAA